MVETVGITGLRENSGPDDGTEEPSWDPRFGPLLARRRRFNINYIKSL